MLPGMPDEPAWREHAIRLPRFVTTAAVVVGLQAVIVIGLIAAGVHPQIALVIGIAVSTVAHFTLNRQWVFTHEGHGFHFHLTAQSGGYVALALFNYAVSALALAVLPDLLGVGPIVVYVMTTVLLGLNNYFVLGKVVFKRALG